MSSSWAVRARALSRLRAPRPRSRAAGTRPGAPGPGRSGSGQRGQALVELALVTPILLLLLLAAVDLGRVFYAQIAVTNAAREGAMVAALTPDSFRAGAACDAETNAVTCAATREGQGGFVTVEPGDVAVTCDPSCAKSYGNEVTVTVTGHFQLITPLLWAFTGGQEVTFEQAATAAVIVTPRAAGVPAPTPTPEPTRRPSRPPTPDPDATPTPTPSPSPTPAPTCAPPFVAFGAGSSGSSRRVTFTSTSTPTGGDCQISYYRWDFGDGTTDAGNDLVGTTHRYAAGGSYNVELTVTTPAGTFSYVAVVQA
jgi:Flp pilus assembly protein TadG